MHIEKVSLFDGVDSTCDALTLHSGQSTRVDRSRGPVWDMGRTWQPRKLTATAPQGEKKSLLLPYVGEQNREGPLR